MTESDFAEFRANARAALLAERTPEGHWVGELSASALSTATAVFTLSLHGSHPHLVRAGLAWLKKHQNADGGWGDTVLSFSNLSTTCLCWAALSIEDSSESATKAEAWIANRIAPAFAASETSVPTPLVSLAANKQLLVRAIADSYGKDRTFSVPILTMLALAGRMPWRFVPQLPFELAALPFWCFQVIRLPVVSYALPALIAIGHVRHAWRPSWNPFARLLRESVKKRTLRKLRAIQPSTGGYLEATPLTSFVAMSLIGAGQADSPVVCEAVRFLEASVRGDGSWPIDTNLNTWVTTLAVNSLSERARSVSPLSSSPFRGLTPPARRDLVAWLLAQQYRSTHPYTRAAPGGWAWTDLPGGVPDADDTPGALLALHNLGEPDESTVAAASAGVAWLLDLQNRDGGIPTFCKGWTGLPFDRSSNDLTAHTLRAWAVWRDRLSPNLQRRIDAGTARAVRYLLRTQHADSSWAPLWFGNQHSQDVANLVYGTSRVLKLAEVSACTELAPALERAAAWLESIQNADGGWGGRAGTPSSIEETTLALEGLLTKAGGRLSSGMDRALAYLDRATERGTRFPPSPIGFYFANLWYYEKLYPIIFTVAALERFANLNDAETRNSET